MKTVSNPPSGTEDANQASEQNNNNDDNDVGVIIGSVIAGLAVVVIAGLLAAWYKSVYAGPKGGVVVADGVQTPFSANNPLYQPEAASN
eukprot:Pgem_evm1s5561